MNNEELRNREALEGGHWPLLALGGLILRPMSYEYRSQRDGARTVY